MDTYLPAPFDFLCWEEIERWFFKNRPFAFPKCVELNITGRDNFNNKSESEIDIFTLERVLREFDKIKLEWLVMGNKNEIFLHKSINSFFKLLSKYNLKIYSLKTNALYLNRVDLKYIFEVVRRNLFIKKNKEIKDFENEIFKENIEKLLLFKIKNNLNLPNIYILAENLSKEEIEEYDKKGLTIISKFYFCRPEIINYLPFFFLSIDKNGSCYSSENNLKPISTIFFNSIKKIWSSKEIIKIRKNLIKEINLNYCFRDLNELKKI